MNFFISIILISSSFVWSIAPDSNSYTAMENENMISKSKQESTVRQPSSSTKQTSIKTNDLNLKETAVKKK